MELYKKYPDKLEFRSYFIRAVILSDTGNTQAAMDDCSIVQTFNNTSGVTYSQKCCADLIAAGQKDTGSTGEEPGTRQKPWILEHRSTPRELALRN